MNFFHSAYKINSGFTIYGSILFWNNIKFHHSPQTFFNLKAGNYSDYGRLLKEGCRRICTHIKETKTIK